MLAHAAIRTGPIGTLIATGVLLACPATAQSVMDLDVGDPARRDQKVAVVLDGIVNSHTAESLTPDVLAARLADVRLLLIGESHDSMEAHRVQLAVIKELVAAGREVVIGLEMYPYTEQQFLDQWVDGMLTERGFVELSRWYRNWGFNWGYYRDVLIFARDQRVKVVAVNTPRQVVSAVRQKGLSGLTEDEAAHIPSHVDTDNDDHLRLFRAYMGPPGSGGHEVSDDALFPMFEAQCTWDATMAYHSVQALAERPDAIMVVLVGSGHVAYGLGIQRQAEQWFDGTVKTLIPVPVADGQGPRHEVQASYADFVWGVAAEPSPLYPSLGISTRQEEDENDSLEITMVTHGSAVHVAGVQVGDTIIAIDGTPVPDRGALKRLEATKNWGDRLALDVERKGERLTFRIVFRRRAR